MSFGYFVQKHFGPLYLRLKAQGLARFERQLERVEEVQLAALRRALRATEKSAFARDHGLTPDLSSDEFARRIDVAGYERIEPYVERMMRGEIEALLRPGTKVVMFAQTSGTTGPSKFVPVTKEVLSDFRRTWTIWACGIARHHPELLLKRSINLASSWQAERAVAGIPVGSVSGLLFASMHGSMRLLYAVPPWVASVEDTKSKFFITLLLGLAEKRVGVLMTANPTTLIKFAQWLNEWKEDLLQCLFDRQLHGDWLLPQKVRQQMQAALRKVDRDRVRWLAKTAERVGRLYPKDAWPELGMLGVWTGGTLTPYLRELPEYYGNLPLRDHGLSASEARMTIPFEDDDPAGVLDVAGNFYEFIPEEEYGKPSPRVLRAWELDPGANYYIILTTPGGLIRYDIADVVRCDGNYLGVPRLAFLHKGSHIANMTGEKLTAHHAARAVAAVQEAYGVTLGHSVLTPDPGPLPGYVLLLEPAQYQLASQLVGFAERLDQALCEANIEYRDKRASGRLLPVVLEEVAEGTWETLERERLARPGVTMEQYKHTNLVTDPSWRLGLKKGRRAT